jgi:serine/threonine-protein kinase
MRDALIGTRINRYEIREAIHRSDVIGIYKAYDTKLERSVLLKTILHSSDYSKEAVDYFLAESRTLARLAHPNIAKVLDFGYEKENLYLVSELVTGTPLSDLMNRPMPWQEAINILLPLTNALIYAHERGIIHRDLKPDNIVVNTDDQPILSDFSLMRIIEEEETRDMTGTNVGLGSPEYISPEQGQGFSADFRSDIYSLGVIFFEMVTGKKLFYATSSMEIVIQHIMADPPRPRSIVPTLPRNVEAVILNALSKDRGKRYQSMEEFSNAMKAVVEAANREKNRGSRRPNRLVMFSALGLLLLMLGVVFRDRLGLFSPAAPTATLSAPTSTRTSVPTSSTPVPATPTGPIATLTPSTLLNDDAFAIYRLPEVPVLSGTRLPESSQALDASNASNIRELARWKSPDIRQLALVNNDRVLLAATSAGLYLFDPADLTARRFIDTAGSLAAFTVSDDGEWVATADVTGALAVWNLLDGSRLYQLTDEKYQARAIKSLDLSPDKTKLVFSDAANRIHFWNLARNQYYLFENKLTSPANKVLFVDEGETILSGDDDFLVTEWDAPSGVPTGKRYRANRSIYDMSLSSDGQHLAAALNEATLQIWDLASGQAINTIQVPRNLKAFTFVTFLPNNSTIVTGSADGFIRGWNITGAEPLWEITSASQDDNPQSVNPVKTATVSKNGTILVVGFENGLVETWDLVTQKRVLSQPLGSIPVRRLVISPDDQFLAIQGDAAVEILSVADESQHTQVNGTLPRGNPISPDSRMIGIQAGDIQLYSLSASAPQPLFQFHDIPVFASVGYSADNLIFSVSDGVTFHYWSTASGLELKAHRYSRQGPCDTFYRRDGSFIVAGSVNGVIFSDANLEHFCGIRRDARATSEDMLPDGSIIALSLQYQSIEVWDIHKDNVDPRITVQTPGHVLDVAISADGKLLATASASGAIEIYNLEPWKHLKTLQLQTGPVHQVLFSNDGKYLIAGFADGTLRFFGIYP